jgi:hypothetical protein
MCRFFDRLLCNVLRPVLVRIRLRNPCLRFRTSLLERASVARGPQRTCVAAKTGLVEMAVLGTTSATSQEGAAAAVGAREAVGVEARKTEPEGRARDGRSVGRDVKVLNGF